jgi:predicted nucleic acid-binding Zn ribbon protein
MPIYEYRRPDGTTFELQQSFAEDALKVDPDTGVPVERVLHAPAVHFKGKGFYNTDYGTRNRERETAAAAAAKESSSKGSSSGGEDSSNSSSSESKAKSDTGSKDSPKPKDSSKPKDSKPVAAKS